MKKKYLRECSFKNLLSMLAGGALIPEFDPGAEEGIFAEKKEDYHEYLKRAEGDILRTLAREVKQKYQPPKGLAKVLLSAVLRVNDRQGNNAAVYTECEKVAKAYLSKLARDYLENESEEAKEELDDIFRDFTGVGGISTVQTLYMRHYEGRKSTGKSIRVGREKTGTGEEKEIYFSAYGLRHRTAYRTMVKGISIQVCDIRKMAAYAVWSRISRLAGTGTRQGILLSETLVADMEKLLRGLCKEGEVPKEIFLDTEGVESCFDTEKFCRMVSSSYVKVTTEPGSSKRYFLRCRVLPWILTGESPLFTDVWKMSLSYADYEELGELLTLWAMDEVSEQNIQHFSHKLGHTARVFETLKNHTDKALKAMAESGFNQYFNFVEIDDGVDINEFEGSYRKDFEAVMIEYFGDWKEKGREIRVRKLGRHRAAGMYFPTLDCLCVDWNHPESTMHEIGHRYDYTHGELSRRAAFMPVQKEYARLLHKAAKDEKAKGFFKGKYDLKYYLLPTEVFARCLEIYLTRICKVENSVVKTEKDKALVYPRGEKLEELIAEYFDRELGVKTTVKTLIAAAEAV